MITKETKITFWLFSVFLEMYYFTVYFDTALSEKMATFKTANHIFLPFGQGPLHTEEKYSDLKICLSYRKQTYEQ